MQDKVQRSHHKDTGCIFLDLYSLHSRSFPNNEFRRVLGRFTASSQLNVPAWILCSPQTAHSCLLCKCALINNGWVPTEYVAPDCRMKQLSVRGRLFITRPPKGEEKWQVCNSSFSAGNWTLFLLGGCPAFAGGRWSCEDRGKDWSYPTNQGVPGVTRNWTRQERILL